MANKQLIASLGLDNSDFLSKLQEAKELLGIFAKEVKKQVLRLKEFTMALKASAVSNYALATSMSASQMAMKALIVASKLLKVALVSTGIGAIVVLLGSLAAYLLTTQAGMDKLRQVTEPVAQIFQRLLGVLQELGGSVFKGISQMLNGELRAGFATLANGAKKAGTATKNAFKDGIKAGGELADLAIEIADAENALILTKSNLNNEIEKATQLSKNEALSEREREKYIQKAIDLTKARLGAEKEVLDLKIKDMRLRQSANDPDRVSFGELNELIAERSELETSGAKEISRLRGISIAEATRELKVKKEINSEIRDKVDLVDRANRNPFSLEKQGKYSDEVLGNIKKISETLLDPALKDALARGVIIPQESIDRINMANEAQAKLNKEIGYASFITSALGQTFQATFEAMIISGKLSFKTLIDGIKALIIKLIAAAAAAFALNALLGGIGLGGSTFGGKSGFQSLFSGLTGLPKFAEGGMVTGLTTAVLGDNPSGKEAVIPFEKMGSFLNKYGSSGSSKVEVFGRLSGEDIILSGRSYESRKSKIIGG